MKLTIDEKEELEISDANFIGAFDENGKVTDEYDEFIKEIGKAMKKCNQKEFSCANCYKK